MSSLKSMTGFGKAEGSVGAVHYSIEVKSVNHRYLDVRFRTPSGLNAFELALTEVLRQRFDRGSFEVVIKPRLPSAQTNMPGSTRFVVDELAMKSLMTAVEWLHQNYKTEKVPSLEMLAQTNRVFVAVEESSDAGTTGAQLKTVFESALADLEKMRSVEGGRLKTILKGGVGELVKLVDKIAELAPQHPKRIQEKVVQRISQFNLTVPVDQQRLEWEVAFYADRADVTEEIDRLRTHASEFVVLLDSPKGVGRKLDFLTQELHREVNTIASKATWIDITRLAVEAKTCIEKLREQVQNVE